jgi:hypothetical protein
VARFRHNVRSHTTLCVCVFVPWLCVLDWFPLPNLRCVFLFVLSSRCWRRSFSSRDVPLVLPHSLLLCVVAAVCRAVESGDNLQAVITQYAGFFIIHSVAKWMPAACKCSRERGTFNMSHRATRTSCRSCGGCMGGDARRNHMTLAAAAALMFRLCVNPTIGMLNVASARLSRAADAPRCSLPNATANVAGS